MSSRKSNDTMNAMCARDKTSVTPRIAKYGWHPSKPDERDYQFENMMRARLLPRAVDLRAHDNPVYDQKDLGSCVANGCGDCWEFALRAAGKPSPLPSRLFIYYFGRVIEGTVASDSGLEVRDGLKVIATQGCCDEKLWPYDVKKFKTKPSKDVLKAALEHRAGSYFAVKQDLAVMKNCLAEGFPIVGGFMVKSSFESPAVERTGVVPIPRRGEAVLGGHCVVIVGYDDAKGWFIVRNSWGAEWGDKGYCYMPYEMWLDAKNAGDLWTVRTVA